MQDSDFDSDSDNEAVEAPTQFATAGESSTGLGPDDTPYQPKFAVEYREMDDGDFDIDSDDDDAGAKEVASSGQVRRPDDDAGARRGTAGSEGGESEAQIGTNDDIEQMNDFDFDADSD